MSSLRPSTAIKTDSSHSVIDVPETFGHATSTQGFEATTDDFTSELGSAVRALVPTNQRLTTSKSNAKAKLLIRFRPLSKGRSYPSTV